MAPRLLLSCELASKFGSFSSTSSPCWPKCMQGWEPLSGVTPKYRRSSFSCKTHFGDFSRAQMPSEKNANHADFPSFSARTSTRKKGKQIHQKSTAQNKKFSPSRPKGSEIKREMKLKYTHFIFRGSACWRGSGRKMLLGWLPS